MNAQLPSRVRLGNFRSALVIEKEDALRSSIVRFLKHQGWLVHGLRRAEQAFPIFAHVLYDLVLTDVELPGITGGSSTTPENGGRSRWLSSALQNAQRSLRKS